MSADRMGMAEMILQHPLNGIHIQISPLFFKETTGAMAADHRIRDYNFPGILDSKVGG